jgi:hypothetical protein
MGGEGGVKGKLRPGPDVLVGERPVNVRERARNPGEMRFLRASSRATRKAHGIVGFRPRPLVSVHGPRIVSLRAGDASFRGLGSFLVSVPGLGAICERRIGCKMITAADRRSAHATSRVQVFAPSDGSVSGRENFLTSWFSWIRQYANVHLRNSLSSFPSLSPDGRAERVARAPFWARG